MPLCKLLTSYRPLTTKPSPSSESYGGWSSSSPSRRSEAFLHKLVSLQNEFKPFSMCLLTNPVHTTSCASAPERTSCLKGRVWVSSEAPCCRCAALGNQQLPSHQLRHKANVKNCIGRALGCLTSSNLVPLHDLVGLKQSSTSDTEWSARCPLQGQAIACELVRVALTDLPDPLITDSGRSSVCQGGYINDPDLFLRYSG